MNHEKNQGYKLGREEGTPVGILGTFQSIWTEVPSADMCTPPCTVSILLSVYLQNNLVVLTEKTQK